ncbi:GNAT family N-acetyltransferase [Phytohabitans flavus]|uniref:GNAT family N-acetyltransferase n=1 Tax=Phytohabitans flavus TaxID=1076124 RepID=UPI0036451034
MEQGGIRVRTARNEDYPAIQRIANAAPDSGAVQFNREHHVLGAYGPDGVNDQVLTVVAEATDKPGLLGSAKLSLGECRFAGAWTRYGLLGALAVHPAHRRRGVATALARHRIQLATESAGEDVLVLANIQAGNEASTAAARWWATGSAGQMTVIPVPMRRRPPRGRPDLLIRPAEEADLEQIAAALLGRGYDLGHRWDPERLRSWLAASPLPQPVNHYLVATDRSGRLLAGLGLREEGRLQSLVVRHAPLSIRLANRVLHVIPRTVASATWWQTRFGSPPDTWMTRDTCGRPSGGSGASAAAQSSPTTTRVARSTPWSTHPGGFLRQGHRARPLAPARQPGHDHRPDALKQLAARDPTRAASRCQRFCPPVRRGGSAATLRLTSTDSTA